MKVLVFTGMPGSGKSEAMSIVSALGIPVYRMGDEIWDEVRHQGLPLTPKHVGEVATSMRTEHGLDIWARRTLDRINGHRRTALEVAKAKGKEVPDEPPVVAIDGSRSLAEIGFFRERLGEDLIVVACHSSSRERRERLLHRGREDDPDSVDVVSNRDTRELGWGLGEAIAMADVHLPNHGSLEEFHTLVRNLLEQYLSGKVAA